jgi:RNA polymerase sigma factor (TIGR02999 family)
MTMTTRAKPEPDPRRERLDLEVSDLYATLHSLARKAVRGRTGKRLLEPTELVHECYLKLARSKRLGTLTQAEFLALAATAIRTVLVDHARALQALKRGGERQRVTLDARILVERPELDLLGLDAALSKLAALDSRMARVVELRYFGGLDTAAVARALGVSPRTVDHDWALAKAWLHRELEH